MMELEYQLKSPQDRVQQAYQQEKMQMDCNLTFPLDDQICKQVQTCTVPVAYSEYKSVHPDKHKELSDASQLRRELVSMNYMHRIK